jgi:hypothetical protein
MTTIHATHNEDDLSTQPKPSEWAELSTTTPYNNYATASSTQPSHGPSDQYHQNQMCTPTEAAPYLEHHNGHWLPLAYGGHKDATHQPTPNNSTPTTV